MATWTTPTTYSTGNPLPVSSWNAVANDTLFLYQKPYANYYNSVSTSVSTSTFTQVTLGGLTASNYGFSVVSNSIVVPLNGVYLISGIVTFAGSTNEQLTIISVNGATVAQAGVPLNALGSGAVATTVQTLITGQAISLVTYQNSGSTQATANTPYNTYLCVAFLGST